MGSLLLDMEQSFSSVWDDWDGNPDIFEVTVFDVLSNFPLRPISLDYEIRQREAGRPLPFVNRDVGRAIVDVKMAIESKMTVGGLVRALDLPRQTVLGCLQIMNRYGWIDFKVEITPEIHLKKVGDVDADTRKAYGDAVVRFVDFCDGSMSMEEVVRKIPNISVQAMRFVAQKLVLDGVLEVVA